MNSRQLTPDDSIPALTTLLHAAYAPLGAMRLNHTAVDQTDAVTLSRIAGGECWLALDSDALVGAVLFRPPGVPKGAPHFERPAVASLGQFAVAPSRQREGFGAILMRHAETRARAVGAAELALDTAEGAAHLIAWYDRQGFRFVEYARLEGKTYRTMVMSKRS